MYSRPVSGGTIVSPYATDVLILIGKGDAVTTADRRGAPLFGPPTDLAS
jgi:hypothetical protein